MNIKQFPPVGTRPIKENVDSQEANSTAENTKSSQIVSKDVFERAKSSTIDHLIAKSNAKDPVKQEPSASCDPMTPAVDTKKLEPTANCITFRVEIAGSCIPMKKLEPVADCEPGTRTLDRVKQQQQIDAQKKLIEK